MLIQCNEDTTLYACALAGPYYSPVQSPVHSPESRFYSYPLKNKALIHFCAKWSFLQVLSHMTINVIVNPQYSNLHYIHESSTCYMVTWNKLTKSGARDTTCSNSVYVSLWVLAMSDSCITPDAIAESSFDLRESPTY